ncbi:MAG: hypothetical protein A3I39_00020 [Candidatus Yanofskybacteria bacterium RIFCSPLOWO2_02_FULL_47_9b]|uniref:Type IV secretion system coupling protein TraD DNA-binding domain-containing protein n=1 Tax=Candidatus Yanofskybacteria bacterium RIFCSPLOWO2_02_FULL_47_9b TaxID=1802708 RepID=A0A1F8H907_9BACT|nr:MAG: hypothetical protein A3I39_00020 [Candidatus Yanofskybacteria bacterium RIFCSPLOWO2_02_FULL_47_9b]
MPNPTDNQILVLGETNFRNKEQRFGIKADDRRRHIYVVGSTGMGKSELLKTMAIQDIEEGRGLAFLDPHGDTADALIDHIPPHRIKDVIYFDPNDLANPIAFNVLDKVDYEYRHLVASGLLSVFKKLWGADAWSGRMEYILNNTILALLEYPDTTLLAINRLMASKEYRKKVVTTLKDPIVKAFWTDEFAKYADKFATEATAAIQNKVGQFSSNNVIRNIVGQVHSKLDLRQIMDEGKILIVNLSKGAIGEDASRLIGALLITKIQLAAMSRVDIPESERRDFYLYVDEFQNFATESFANILSEARKYHLALVIAHQYIQQIEEEVADAVFGNVGSLITFRVGAEDAEFLEKWYAPDFMATDIVNLGKRDMYIKLMVNGITSKGFSAQTIDSFAKLEKSNRADIIDFSRHTYSTPREQVEQSVMEWAAPIVEASPAAPRHPGNPSSARRSFNGGGGQQQPRPPQRQQQNNFRSPQPPVAPRQEGVSLNSLQGGLPGQGAVDFKGRPLRQSSSEASRIDQKEKGPKPTAETTSFKVPAKELDSAELKKLIEEALKK